jgi:hypothetical protein
MESKDIGAYMDKATAISKTLIPYPSRWSHPDEQVYLYNQLDRAISYTFSILKDIKLNGETAKEKWTEKMNNPLTKLVEYQLIQACLDENFKTAPQKCSLTREQENEYGSLAYQDGYKYGY